MSVNLIRVASVLIFTAVIIAGCAGNRSPVTPDDADSRGAPTGSIDTPRQDLSSSDHHACLLYNLIYIDVTDPDNPTFEVVPVREGMFHLNILNFLEDGPCFDCFSIAGFSFPQPGYLNLDLHIDHPFKDPALSVFDVRGIMMFQGSHIFPASGKSISDPAMGDGALIYAEGYTSLYNGSTLNTPAGLLQKYLPGNLSTPAIPNSDINGYKYFVTDDPPNDRNGFFGGLSDTVSYTLKLPTGPFVIGYAIDANWWTPIDTPVYDPVNDFDLDANCPEAWKIVVQEAGPGLTWEGGTTKLLIDVYDWQGKDDVHPALVECPELFDGKAEAQWKSDGDGYSRYEAVIGNSKLAPAGDYICLVSKEAQENDPSGQPWMDLTAYEIFTTSVLGNISLNPVDVTPPWLNISPVDICIDGNYAYMAGGYDGLYIFDFTDPVNPVWVNQIDTAKAWEVAVSDGYACVADGYSGIRIIDIDPPESAYIVNTIDLPGQTYCVAMAYGYAYAASDGKSLYIIDIDPPESAYIVSTIDLIGYPKGIELMGGYAYVADYNSNIMKSSLDIIDIDPPESAYIMGTVGNLDEAEGLAVSGSYAYIVAEKSPILSVLYIINIEDPTSSCLINSIDLPPYAYDVAVSDGYAYVVSMSSGFHIVDISPPESAYYVNTIQTSGNVYGLALSGEFAYVVDRYKGIHIMDISVPESAFIVRTFGTTRDARSVAVSGNYAYLACDYSGFRVVDVSTPENAFVVKTIDTIGADVGVAVSGGYAYVADEGSPTSCLRIFNVQIPESAYLLNSVFGLDNVTGVAVAGNYAYVSQMKPAYYAYTGYIQIINIEPPQSGYIVNTPVTSSAPFGLAVSGGFAYIAASYGLYVMDIEPPESANIVASVNTGGSSHGVAVAGEYAYIVSTNYEDNSWLRIIDIDPPESAMIISNVDIAGEASGVAVSGGYAFVTAEKVLYFVDIEPPESAFVATTMDLPYNALGVTVHGGYVYVADDAGGLRIIRL